MGNKHVKGKRHNVEESHSHQTSTIRDTERATPQVADPVYHEPIMFEDTKNKPIVNANLLLKDCLSRMDVESILSANEISAIRSHLETFLNQNPNEPITIPKKEFYRFLLANPNSLYVNRLYAVFDVSNQGYITFQELLRGLAILSRKATRDQKLILSFHLLDFEGTGYISKAMTTELLRSCINECRDTGLYLSDQDISRIVERTFEEADLDKNNLVDLKEYQMLDNKHARIFDFLTIDAFGVLNHLEKVRSAAIMNEASAVGGM